jgi:hypothetical protein
MGDLTGITTNPKKEGAYRPEIMPADGLTSLLKSEFKLEGDPRNLRETYNVVSRSQLSGIRLVPDRLRETKSQHRHDMRQYTLDGARPKNISRLN